MYIWIHGCIAAFECVRPGRLDPVAADRGNRRADGGAMIRSLLVDYGEVLSAPLTEDAIADLAALAGQPRAAFLDRYWELRPAYDLGQPTIQYWSAVLGRDLSGSSRLVDRLTRVDVRGWLHRNPRTLRVLVGHAQRAGARLALLSNAPEPLPAPLISAAGRGTSTSATTAAVSAPPSPPRGRSNSRSATWARSRARCCSSMTGPRTPAPPATSECARSRSRPPVISTASCAWPPPGRRSPIADPRSREATGLFRISRM